MPERLPTITLRDVTIVYPNFAGKAGNSRFSKEGRREFAVLINDGETADALAGMGLNVKEAERLGGWTLNNIKVNFNSAYPPVIYKVTSKAKVVLNEQTVACLDTAEIVKADLVLNQSKYGQAGREGISLYLKTAYVTIAEDELTELYADIPTFYES